MYFWGCGGIFNLGNSRIFVIASEAKQSLRNSKFILRNSKFLLALVGQAPLLANFIRAAAPKPPKNLEFSLAMTAI